jgi:hypothetical protein
MQIFVSASRDFADEVMALGRSAHYALMVAATRTAVDVKSAEVAEMQSVFDRPASWTLNSLQVRPAQRSQPIPTATVEFKYNFDKGTGPGRYLQAQLEGGMRRYKPYEAALHYAGKLPRGWYTVPGPGIELNAYGNISQGQIDKILSALGAMRKNPAQHKGARRGTRRWETYFYVPPEGHRAGRVGGGVQDLKPGVYRLDERTGDISYILRYVQPGQYDRRFDYFGVADRIIQTRFAAQFRRGMDEWAARRVRQQAA